MTKNITLKYNCLDKYQEVLSRCKDEEAKTLLVEMFDLIRYQMAQITDQRMEIIAFKHKKAWGHYDRPLDQYDVEKRKYIEKPEKSDNISC